MALHALALLVPLVAARPAASDPPRDGTQVRGMTISSKTWGREWGTDGFARELDVLAGLGVNWVAIHPYAGIRADGSLHCRELDPRAPPEWIARPIREAHARGLSILVVPLVAQWGSPWRHRGEIAFADEAALARFFADYERFVTDLASCARDADAFAVASELDGLAPHEERWRAVIAALRRTTGARLAWAASWNHVESVPFWDALDCIGVQAYYPLSAAEDPGFDELLGAWRPILAELRELSTRSGKPVVFTEIGYPCSLAAAREPWSFAEQRGSERARAEALQVRCLEAAFAAIEPERAWLRGAILWKWFVGPAGRENFLMSEPGPRAAVARTFGAGARR
jgi:hypothetical protein